MSVTAKHRVLYLAPRPPVRSGIADYADSLAAAIEQFTRWELVTPDIARVKGNSIRDWIAVRRRVQSWIDDGTFDRVALVHAEVGFQQHDELYTLYWLHKLAPHVPYIITVHDPPLVTVPVFYYYCLGSNATRIRHLARLLDYTPMARSRVAEILSCASSVVSLTGRGGEMMKARYGLSRVLHIPHLMLTEPPDDIDRSSRDDALTILFMGFWSPAKGIETLIRAVEIVHSRYPGRIRFLLTGGANSQAASKKYEYRVCDIVLRSSISSITELPGYLADDQFQPTLDSADIFVLPYLDSHGASASGPIVRALASGLPIVASDICAFREEIETGVNGLLIGPGDPKALASAIEMLIVDKPLRQRLGSAARTRATAQHDRKAVANSYTELYEGLLSGDGDRLPRT